MGKLIIAQIVAGLAIFSLLQAAASGVELTGNIDDDSGENWQSSFMDLDSIRDFKKGDKVIIRVEGTAEWVLVRMLPENGKPDKPVGIIGPKMKVPAGGKLTVLLEEDRPRIRQISVHAGKEAWHKFIDSKGGKVFIVGIDLNP